MAGRVLDNLDIDQPEQWCDTNQGRLDKIDDTTDKGARKCKSQQLDRMYFLRRDLNSEKLFTEARDDGREENIGVPWQHIDNFLKVVQENSDLNWLDDLRL